MLFKNGHDSQFRNNKYTKLLNKYETVNHQDKYVKGEYVNKTTNRDRKRAESIMYRWRTGEYILVELEKQLRPYKLKDYHYLKLLNTYKFIIEHYGVRDLSTTATEDQAISGLCFVLVNLYTKAFKLKQMQKTSIWKKYKLNQEVYHEILVNYSNIRLKKPPKSRFGVFKFINDLSYEEAKRLRDKEKYGITSEEKTSDQVEYGDY